jgi:adenosylcobinamide-GDP ribazoletransferase
MEFIKYQWELFLLALSFFTRIPVPSSTPYSLVRMNKSGRYFPLVGIVLGLLLAALFTLLKMGLPSDICLFITMAASLLLTGAFHEDGLADMADGIGGGMTLEKRLTIMKDSRIGTYGSAALIVALLGKFVLLKWLLNSDSFSITTIFLLGYACSRAIASSLIYNTPYVSDIDQSKSKPIAEQQSKMDVVIVFIFGVLPVLWLPLPLIMALVLIGLSVRFLFKQWLLKRLGGFTGDCLGALQQVSELIIYIILIMFSHNQWI